MSDECKESYKVCMADHDARLIQAIADHPEASIPQLCRIANVSHATVDRVRKWLRNPYPSSPEEGSHVKTAEHETDWTDEQLDQEFGQRAATEDEIIRNDFFALVNMAKRIANLDLSKITFTTEMEDACKAVAKLWTKVAEKHNA